MAYKKTCKQCGKEFESESRGTRYCSAECCEKAQGRNKRRARRRREYDKNREANLMVSTAYALAQRVAKMYSIPQDPEVAKAYVVSMVGECPEGEGRWELHHKNGNVLQNNPENLVWLQVNQHAFFHSKIGNVNFIALLEGKEEANYNVKVSLLAEALEESRKVKK